MANERTLLAWLRTALALVVAGVALTALADYTRESWLIAAATTVACLAGSFTAVMAYLRWQALERALRLQKPLPAPSTVLAVVAAVVGLAALAFGALLARSL
ncbi:MAG: DUF202 domain-containing protein [Nitriliruptorales bacterium]|nr:DUF202 domain-containing protein [Nitriliruptorales bacterium]